MLNFDLMIKAWLVGMQIEIRDSYVAEVTALESLLVDDNGERRGGVQDSDWDYYEGIEEMIWANDGPLSIEVSTLLADQRGAIA